MDIQEYEQKLILENEIITKLDQYLSFINTIYEFEPNIMERSYTLQNYIQQFKNKINNE